MDPKLEQMVLKSHYEELAQQHLTFIKKTMMDRASQAMSISKPIFFAMLIGEQAVDFYKKVDELRKSFANKNDASIDEILTCFLYMHRVGEYFKIGRNAMELDKANPNQIQDKSFWEAMENDYDKKEELYKDCINNLLFVLTEYVGENWQVRMPKVTQCFDFYVDYWKANIDFE